METKISAGSYDLNKWLFGGYEKDIITTLYGPPGCGKTNFCMLVSASQAKKGNKVIFIDTEGGFSLDRFKQILKEEHAEALKNIILLKPTNFQEQKQAFSKLLQEIKGKEVSLIVIDGMTMLYRLDLGDAIKDKDTQEIHNINSELARQLRTLAEISRKRNIPVIVTNQVYSNFLSDEEIKAGREKQVSMVGGDILKYWSKCLIEIQNEKGKRKAILRKHRSLKESELNFIITNEGVKKRGWL
jgi:DNA repair protein RadB